MAMHHDGGCLCGHIRYEFDGEPAAAVHCHCRDCQKATGSGFTTVLAVARDNFRMSRRDAELRDFTVTSEAGRQVTREFCSRCGSPLFTRSALNPGVIFIKAGSLDDASWLSPSASCWTSRAQPWAAPPEGVAHFPKNPPL